MTSLDTLQTIFRDVFDDPSIDLTDSFSPASYSAWDSLAMVRLVLSIEPAFGVRFTTDQVANIKSVGDILAVVEPARR